MTNWKCKDCLKSFASKQNYDNHISRDAKCVKAVHKCEYCDKRFTTKTSLYRHKRTVCKEIPKSDNNDKDEDNDSSECIIQGNPQIAKIYERLVKLEMENSNLKSQVKELKTGSNVVNNTTNNLSNCNVNTGTVNNYYLVGYGKEDLSKVDHNDLLKGMRMGFNSTQKLIDTIHFNPKYPEFHNVYISSMKNKYAMMYDGTTWALVMKDDLIDKLYDDKRNYIEENLEEFVGSLTPSQINALHRWMDADDTHPYISKIKNDIKLLLYNKRYMPLNNKNKIKNLPTVSNHEEHDSSKSVKVAKEIKNITSVLDLDSEPSMSRKSKNIRVKGRFQRTAPRNGSKRKVAKVRRN